MKKILIPAALLVTLLTAGATTAADKPLTPQQQKMADCNQQAAGKKGDERKSLMSACLKAAKPEEPAAVSPQQQKMKDCNKQATGKKGADRKAFMKECLSAAKN